eukprot:COSAG05_NODE_20068_length_283_cov_1.130435_1_plen_23_part_01
MGQLVAHHTLIALVEEATFSNFN